MSISTPPPPAPQKKRGLGCLGCGCLILVLIIIIIVALMGGAGYLTYKKVLAVTSPAPADLPSVTVTDNDYTAVKQKLADFNHDVKNHQAATLQLSADEINTLLARDPDAIKNNLHGFVSLTGQEGRLQASMPLDALSQGLVKGRYVNLDLTFEVHFDATTHSVNLIAHALKFGDTTYLGPDAPDPKAAQAVVNAYTPILNQQFNAGIRKNSDTAALLDQTRSIEIQNGQLVIETQ